MTDNAIPKKPASITAQLLFIFGWLLTIVFISAAGSDSGQTEAVNASLSPTLIRILIVFQGLLVFILPIVFFLFILRRTNFRFLTITNGLNPMLLIVGILSVLFSYPFIEWVGNLNAGLTLPPSFHGWEEWMKGKEKESAFAAEALLKDKSVGGLIGNLLTIAFTAAFCEELFFRGMMQKTLMKAKVNPHLAVWITAIIFSAIHLQFYGFLPRLFLGAILGYLFYFSGKIWISIIAHFVNNAMVVVVGFFSSEVELNPLENSNEVTMFGGHPLLALVSLLLVAGTLIFIHRNYQQPSSEIDA
jgi:uncharacterized protein